MLVATPAGVWLAARAAESAAGSRGWSLRIDGTGGLLVASPRFADLAGTAGGVEARVQELVLHPWDWGLSLRGPEVRWRPAAAADTAAEVSGPVPPSGAPPLLPVGDLPRIDIVDGVLEVNPERGPSVALRGIEARLAPGESPLSSVLDLSAEAWSIASDSTSAEGRLSTRWHLGEGEVVLEEARVDWRAAGVGQGTLGGRGRLELGSGMEVDVGLTLEGRVGSMQVDRLEVTVRGPSFPPRIDVTALGEGSEPGLGDVGLAMSGRVDTSGIRADSLWLRAAGGTLAGRGGYRPAGGRLQTELEVRDVDLARLPLAGYAGILDGRLTVDGSLSSPRASMALRFAGLEGIAPEPVDLDLDGSIEGEGVRLKARSQTLGELTASGDLSLETGLYDLQLAGGLDLGPWLGSALPASAGGRWRPGILDLRLQSEEMPFGLDLPGPLVAEGALRDFRHLDLSLRLGTGQLSARLRTDLASAQLDTLSAAALDLELSQVGPLVEGRASGRAAADGLLGHQGRGGLQLQVDDLRLAGWSLGPTSLAADYVRGAVELAATAPGVELLTRVDSGGRTEVKAILEDAILRRVGAPDSLRVRGRASASGDLRDPMAGSLEVRLDEAAATLAGWPLVLGGAAVFKYAGGRGTLHRSRVRTPLGEVRLKAGIDAGRLDLTAALDSVESTGIEDLTARGRVAMRLDGAPAAPDLALQVDLEALALQGREIGALSSAIALDDSLRAALELRQDTSSAVQLAIQVESPSSVVRGGPPAGSDSLGIRLRAKGLDASWLATWVLGDSTGLRVSAEGDLGLPAARVLEASGWLDLAGSLTLSELTLDRDRLRLHLPEPASAHLRGGEASIEGFELPVLVFRRDIIEFDEAAGPPGAGGYEKAGILVIEGEPGKVPGAVRLRLGEVDLEAVTLAVPGLPRLPPGWIDGSIELVSSAEGASLGAQAHVDLDDLGYLEASLSAGAESWSARGAWVTLVEDSLVVTADVPVAEGRPAWEGLSLAARSDGIDLLVFLDRLPLESLAGRVRLDLRADSLRARPRIAGQVEVEDLDFSLINIRPGYRFPQGRLVLAPKAGGGTRGELVGFAGDPAQEPGHLQLLGWVEVAALDEVDYELRLAGEVPYNYSDYFQAPRVDLDLALTGEQHGSLLKGRVSLNQSLSEVQLVELTGPVPPPPAVQDPLLGGVAMDVYVDIVELKSRSELSDIDVDGRVRVYGTFYKPRFQGELEVIEGTVILLSRPFAFTPGGRVVLDKLVPTYSILDLIHDPILLDPELDLEAIARVRDPEEDEEVEVTLSLEGTVLAPDPGLTSPGLGERQIIGLLAFGTLDQNRYNYSGALYTAAGQLLLGRVQKAGLDEFLLLPSGTAQGTIGESSIRIGKRLTWPLPMWVRYEAVTKEPSLGQFEVEYPITSWLLLEATAHSQYETYGMGLEVSKDF